MKNTKTLEIAGKTYTFTANRSIVKTLYRIAPSILELNDKGEPNKEGILNAGLDIMANLDVLFYDMIKIAHPEITKEKSDEILDKCEEEYDNVQEKFLDFALSVFTLGDQKKNKKKIDW